MQMTEELRQKYNDTINFMNADNMFFALESLVNEYGLDYILKKEHEDEKSLIESYVLRSNAIRFSCDTIEHYVKAILIMNGSSWDQSKSWGHNLLELFRNLDTESQAVLTESLEYNEINLKINTNKEEIIGYIFNMLKKYSLFNVKEINEEQIDELINCFDNFNKNYDPKEYQEESRNGQEINDDSEGLNKEINEEKAESIINNYGDFNIENVNYEKEKFIKPIVVHHSDVITPLTNGQTIEQELGAISPEKGKGQLLTIKSRFPGQYLVDGPSSFLISLAYALRDLSISYRKTKGITIYK